MREELLNEELMMFQDEVNFLSGRLYQIMSNGKIVVI